MQVTKTLVKTELSTCPYIPGGLESSSAHPWEYEL